MKKNKGIEKYGGFRQKRLVLRSGILWYFLCLSAFTSKFFVKIASSDKKCTTYTYNIYSINWILNHACPMKRLYAYPKRSANINIIFLGHKYPSMSHKCSWIIFLNFHKYPLSGLGWRVKHCLVICKKNNLCNFWRVLLNDSKLFIKCCASSFLNITYQNY